MIIQSRDKFGKINVLAFGTINKRPDGTAIMTTKSRHNIDICWFSVCCGANYTINKNGEKETEYQILNCAYVCRPKHPSITAIVKSLNVHDDVLIGGKITISNNSPTLYIEFCIVVENLFKGIKDLPNQARKDILDAAINDIGIITDKNTPKF